MTIFRRPIILLILAVPVVLALAGFAHYQVWLRSFEGTPVTVVPGKWVWVECHTEPFQATIERVGWDGVTIRSEENTIGLPCPSVGISSLSDGRYFFPFRTVLEVEHKERYRWINPFPI